MKTFSLSIYTVLFSFAFSTASAQVSASSEPRGEVDHSGEVIILPFQYTEPEPEVIAERAPAKQIIRNVSQKRDAKMGQMSNGYYQMVGNHDWGTSIRLNSYGYVTTVTKAAKPKLASADSTTEIDGRIAQANPNQVTMPGVVQPVAFK